MPKNVVRFVVAVLLLLTGLSANAAVTGCNYYYTTVGNTVLDRYVYPIPPGPNNCYPTVNQAYDEAIAAANARLPVPYQTGTVTYGPDYGKTWSEVVTLKKVALTLAEAGAHSDGRYANCSEPLVDFGDAATGSNNFAWCGVEETHTVTLSDGQVSVSTQKWEITGALGTVCHDGYLVPNGSGGVVCRFTVDIYKMFLDCPSCTLDLILANPIYPMRGSKREVVGTGFSVGGRELQLVYDSSARAVHASLWNSNFHKSMNVANLADGTFSVRAYRGSGQVVGSAISVAGKGIGAGFDACGGSALLRDSIQKVGSSYQYNDVKAGALEVYNTGGRLTGLYNAGGGVNTTTFSDANTPASVAPAPGYILKVTDHTGKFISFTYVLPPGRPSASGALISTISNSQGQSIVVGYDAHWNMSTLTWPDAKVRTFLYEDSVNTWALTGIIDENNTRFATWTYSADGDALTSEHAGGVGRGAVDYGAARSISSETIVEEVHGNYLCRYHTFNPPASLQLTDANGKVSTATVDTSTGTGLLTGLTQPAGSGCGATTSASTVDARGNLTSRDDFEGMRTCYAYNAANQEITRIEGLANTVACSSVLPASATLPTGARRYTTTWDPSWKAPVQLAQPGSVTTSVYHGRPDPKNGNTVANCSPAAALPNGAPLNLLCKQVIEKASGAAFDNPLGASSDPQIDKVVLLLHGEDGEGSPVFADSSSYMKVPSATLSVEAKVSTAQKRFGSGSLGFSSSGAASYQYSSSTFAFTGDFTMETFVYLNAPVANRYIFQWGRDSNGYGGGNLIVDDTGKLSANWAYNGYMSQVIVGPVVSTGAWHHVALSRISGNWVMHLDGVSVGGTQYNTENASFATGKFTISYGLNGYLDEVRVTNGMSRYPLGNFTPPTAAFPDPLNLNPSAPKVADTHYAKDILLIHADGIDGTQAVTDSSPLAKTANLTRNAKISTAKSKFGGSSIYVPGGTDWGDRVVFTGDYSLPSDFTVEFWMNADAASIQAVPVQIGNGNDATWVQFGLNGDYLTAGFKDGVNCWSNSNLTAQAGKWAHVAYVRAGGTLSFYLNGVQTGNCTRAGTVGGVSNAFVGMTSTTVSNVYLDDIRITKGVARYTSAFVPSPYAAPNVAVLTPDASTIINQYTYDAQGRILTAKDSNNRTTIYAYYAATDFTGVAPNAVGHTIGDLQSITDPKGFVTTFNAYDMSGRVLQMTDLKGVVTAMTYTPRGWVNSVTVTPPGAAGRVTTYTYDAVGQVIGVANPDGTTVSYTYDAAHRLVGATDAKGNSVNYTLDNVGNRIAEQLKDPSGVLQRTMSRSFDALNRVQQLQLQ